MSSVAIFDYKLNAKVFLSLYHAAVPFEFCERPGSLFNFLKKQNFCSCMFLSNLAANSQFMYVLNIQKKKISIDMDTKLIQKTFFIIFVLVRTLDNKLLMSDLAKFVSVMFLH